MGFNTTIREIACIANVSVSTVSKALNNSPEISMNTRLRIKRIAIAQGYKPNSTARALKSKNTGSIGIIVPDISSSFFSIMVQGIEARAKKRGLRSYICFSNESLNMERKLVDSFMNHSVDGVIMSLSKQTQSAGINDHLTRLNMHVPMVMVDRVCDHVECDKVVLDDFEAGRSALRYLVDTGCRNIVFLTAIKATSVSQYRMAGFKEEFCCLKKSTGFRLKAFTIELNGYDGFENKLNKVLNENSIDAIIATDELGAIKTHGHLQRKGYMIPNEVSIIGFTNGEMSQNIYPSLTMVSQRAKKIGERALDRLVLRILNKDRDLVPKKIAIKHKLILRETTRQPNFLFDN